MTARVHPTALVDPAARLGVDVEVGPFAVVGPAVRLDDGVRVAARATLEGPTHVGPRCAIGVGAVLGTPPQDHKYRGEATALRIGADTTLREYVTVHRGTVASGATVIGDGCYLMTASHVAHDCRLGHGVILGNNVQLAGHVTIDDHAQIGGLTPIHQFARIGTHAFVGGGSRVPQDVPPYALAAGNPLRLCGINAEGLRRAGFAPEVRLALKRAFRLLFNSALPRREAVERIEREAGAFPEVRLLLAFLSRSRRGVLV